jgi:integrase
MMPEIATLAKQNKRKEKDTKKAGNGQGSVRELPNGKWRWEVTLGYTLEGKRQSVSGVCANQTEAGIAKAKAVADHARGLLGASETVTLADYTERWLERQQDIRASARRNYKLDLDYALERLGKLKLKDIRPHHVKDCLTELSKKVMTSGSGKGKPMSSRTLGMVRARLKAVFREAVIDGIIYVNPCEAVRRIKTAKDAQPVGIALDFLEMTRFHELGLALYEAKVLRFFPALFAAASLGLRRGEVMGLRWQDVDFEKNVIRVRQNLVTIAGKPHLHEPKTRYSRRNIPLPLTLKNILLTHQQRQHHEREKAGEAWHDTGALFATETGEYTHPDNFGRALRNLVTWSDAARFSITRCLGLPVNARAKLETIIKAGEKLPDLRPHDLRHTAATLMLRRGVPAEVVSRILGHSKVSVTLDIYRHVLESEKKMTMPDLFDTPLPVRELPQMTLN